MILRDVAIYVGGFPTSPEDRAVEDSSRVVCSLMLKSFGNKIRTPGYFRIGLKLKNPDRSDANKIIGNVLFRHVCADLSDFPNLTDLQKGEFLLKLIVQQLRPIFEEYALPLSELSKAENFVVEQDFRNEFVGKKRVPDSTGGRVAYVAVEQDVSGAKIYLCVAEKRKRLPPRKFLVAEDSPNEFVLQAYFGRVEWLDGQRVQLTRVCGTTFEASVGL
jgi:hypothetical protein